MEDIGNNVTYDWDHIMVADADLDDSQQFFGMRRDAILQIHNDKENFAHVINRNQTMSTRDLIEITQKFKKESAQAIAETAPATRQAEVVENPNTAPNDDQKIDKIASDLENLLQMIAKNKLSKENAPSTAANTKKPLNSAKSVPKPTSAVPSGSSGPLLPKQPQLQRKGSTASTSSSHASGPPTKQTKAPTAVPPRPANPPNAYNYVAIYKAKNTRAEERRREQEREARAFRPRPLPDFKRSHRLMESKLSELKKMPVLPQTPPTLKRSIEAAARRQAIQEEKLRASKPADFKSRPADVLVCRPYKPQVESREIVAEPFDLHSEERSTHRKAYNDAYAKAQELKLKKEKLEEESKERVIRQNIRKQTVFRARPNPFSSN